jgi:hypothetical protein
MLHSHGISSVPLIFWEENPCVNIDLASPFFVRMKWIRLLSVALLLLFTASPCQGIRLSSIQPLHEVQMKSFQGKGPQKLFPNLRHASTASSTLRLRGGMDRIGISTDIDDVRIHKAIRKNLASKRGRRYNNDSATMQTYSTHAP